MSRRNQVETLKSQQKNFFFEWSRSIYTYADIHLISDLTYILTLYHTFWHSIWRIFRHFFCHCICKSIWHFKYGILSLVWSGILSEILYGIWSVVLSGIQSGSLFGIRFDTLYGILWATWFGIVSFISDILYGIGNLFDISDIRSVGQLLKARERDVQI
jgi:hypothetical protein